MTTKVWGWPIAGILTVFMKLIRFCTSRLPSAAFSLTAKDTETALYTKYCTMYSIKIKCMLFFSIFSIFSVTVQQLQPIQTPNPANFREFSPIFVCVFMGMALGVEVGWGPGAWTAGLVRGWVGGAVVRMVRVAGICTAVKGPGACARVTTGVAGLIWACWVIIWAVLTAGLKIPDAPGAESEKKIGYKS